MLRACCCARLRPLSVRALNRVVVGVGAGLRLCPRVAVVPRFVSPPPPRLRQRLLQEGLPAAASPSTSSRSRAASLALVAQLLLPQATTTTATWCASQTRPRLLPSPQGRR
jgi:hypothetical protein